MAGIVTPFARADREPPLMKSGLCWPNLLKYREYFLGNTARRKPFEKSSGPGGLGHVGDWRHRGGGDLCLGRHGSGRRDAAGGRAGTRGFLSAPRPWPVVLPPSVMPSLPPLAQVSGNAYATPTPRSVNWWPGSSAGTWSWNMPSATWRSRYRGPGILGVDQPLSAQQLGFPSGWERDFQCCNGAARRSWRPLPNTFRNPRSSLICRPCSSLTAITACGHRRQGEFLVQHDRWSPSSWSCWRSS